MSRNCRKRRRESKGPSQTNSSQAKQIQSGSQKSREDRQSTEQVASTPENLLYSDSDSETAKSYTLRVADGGSIAQCVKVQVQGVPAYGLIDTGADISIIGGKLFKKVTTVARLQFQESRQDSPNI